MKKILDRLVEVLKTACGDNLTVHVKDGQAQFNLDLGVLGATTFAGLWGAANMAEQRLELSFMVDADFVSDGQVYVKTDAESLVYGSDIEYVIEDMIKEASNGLISGTGSEQGMQVWPEKEEEGGWIQGYSIDVAIDSPVFEELTDTIYA